MKWLIEKEYFDSEGDERTAMIRSELKNCMSKIEEVKKLILTLIKLTYMLSDKIQIIQNNE